MEGYALKRKKFLQIIEQKNNYKIKKIQINENENGKLKNRFLFERDIESFDKIKDIIIRKISYMTYNKLTEK